VAKVREPYIRATDVGALIYLSASLPVAPFCRWQTQTFIIGLTCEALITPWVAGVAMDRTAFNIYGHLDF